jgi:CRISPR-associated protein Csm2
MTVQLSLPDGKDIDEVSFADFAKSRIPLLEKDRNDRFRLTTSKLRDIYSLIMNIYTKVNDEPDFQKHLSDIQYLKVKMAYESGRERTVRDFIDRTYLMAAVDSIKTYDQFLLYCRYAESLVAYFKFYGGRD